MIKHLVVDGYDVTISDESINVYFGPWSYNPWLSSRFDPKYNAITPSKPIVQMNDEDLKRFAQEAVKAGLDEQKRIKGLSKQESRQAMILDHHPDFGAKVVEKMKNAGQYVQKAIGYWYSEREPDLPKPQDYVDVTWDKDECEKVANYLDAGERVISWMGYSDCRFCGKDNGVSCLSDGIYIWPEGFGHYLRAHHVKPPKEFIEHVLKMIG